MTFTASSTDFPAIADPSAPPLYSEIFPEEQESVETEPLTSNIKVEQSEPSKQSTENRVHYFHNVTLLNLGQSRYQIFAQKSLYEKVEQKVSLESVVKYLNKCNVKNLTLKCSPRDIAAISRQLDQEIFRNIKNLEIDVLKSPDSSPGDMLAVRLLAFNYLKFKKLSYLRMYDGKITGATISPGKRNESKCLVCKCKNMHLHAEEVTIAIENLTFEPKAKIWVSREFRSAIKIYAKSQENYKKKKNKYTFTRDGTRFTIGDEKQQIDEKGVGPYYPAMIGFVVLLLTLL